MATAAMMGTTCRNNTTSPGKGSGNGLRITTSNHTHMTWLKAHMTMPAVIRLQNRRVCPRLSKAFLAQGMQAATITSSGIRSPSARRKKGLGNTAGARAKTSSRPTPQRSDGMGRKDTTHHDMTFCHVMFRSRTGYGGHHGNGLSGMGRKSWWHRARCGRRLLELGVMAFPVNRLRRLRRTETLRTLVRETRLTPETLVYPLFVCPGTGIRKEVRSMPGVFNLSVDEAVKEVRATRALGVLSVILFGLPEKKDEVATGAWAEDGIVQKAARAIKSEVRDVLVMGDVCLCEYMSHGHCGIVAQSGRPQSLGAAAMDVTKAMAIAVSSPEEKEKAIERMAAAAAAPPATAGYEILNDASLELLARTSVSLAREGVDIIAQ